MKKLLFLLVIVCVFTFTAKADNPPTGSENATSITEEITAPKRPDCIPEGWQYEGDFWTSGYDSHHVDLWSSSTCGYKEYKVYGSVGGYYRCLNAYYDASEHIMTFWWNERKYQFRF